MQQVDRKRRYRPDLRAHVEVVHMALRQYRPHPQMQGVVVVGHGREQHKPRHIAGQHDQREQQHGVSAGRHLEQVAPGSRRWLAILRWQAQQVGQHDGDGQYQHMAGHMVDREMQHHAKHGKIRAAAQQQRFHQQQRRALSRQAQI